MLGITTAREGDAFGVDKPSRPEGDIQVVAFLESVIASIGVLTQGLLLFACLFFLVSYDIPSIKAVARTLSQSFLAALQKGIYEKSSVPYQVVRIAE